MSSQISTIRVFARIYLLTPEEGGREFPILGVYRPDHFFGELKDGAFMGQIELSENEMLHLGETKDLWITFIDSPGLNAQLFRGNSWRINEADKPVAVAEVLMVENK